MEGPVGSFPMNATAPLAITQRQSYQIFNIAKFICIIKITKYRKDLLSYFDDNIVIFPQVKKVPWENKVCLDFKDKKVDPELLVNLE